MPQGDLLTFGPALLFVPLNFLLGYYFWVTVWAPRILLTLKARFWITQFRSSAGLSFLSPVGDSWPEIFLMFIQFAGLLFFLSTLSLAPTETFISPAPQQRHKTSTVLVPSDFPVWYLWGSRRKELFFKPAAAELTNHMATFLEKLPYWVPVKQFPTYGKKLRARLSREAPQLSGYTASNKNLG